MEHPEGPGLGKPGLTSVFPYPGDGVAGANKLDLNLRKGQGIPLWHEYYEISLKRRIHDEIRTPAIHKILSWGECVGTRWKRDPKTAVFSMALTEAWVGARSIQVRAILPPSDLQSTLHPRHRTCRNYPARR